MVGDYSSWIHLNTKTHCLATIKDWTIEVKGVSKTLSSFTIVEDTHECDSCIRVHGNSIGIFFLFFLAFSNVLITREADNGKKKSSPKLRMIH